MTIYVSSGITSTGLSIYWDYLYVLSGGIVGNTIINDHGLMVVDSGGVATSAIVNSGGTAQIQLGGVASGTIVNSGAGLVLALGSGTTQSGANGEYVINGIIVHSGSHLNLDVNNGGIVSGIVIGGVDGGVTIESGGIGIGTVLNGAETNGNVGECVWGGGIASGTVINSGRTELVQSGGITIGTIVNSGGLEKLNSGGFSKETTVNSGGSEYILAGGIASGTVVNGGVLVNYGITSGTVLNRDGNVGILGVEYLHGGAVACGTVANDGGQLQISAGAIGIGTILNGGSQVVWGGGIASGTVINSGGIQAVVSGGVTSGTVVNSGGLDQINAGCSAIGEIVNNGGTVWIFPTSSIQNLTFQHGGVLDFMDTTVTSAILNNQNQLILMNGSQIINAIGLNGIYTGTTFSTQTDAFLNGTLVKMNDAPIFTSLISTLITGNEDTQITISLADIQTQSNASGPVGTTITSYVVKTVSSGILMIGVSAGNATAWAVGTNDTIDATHYAFWTSSANANGSLNAFTVVAKDSLGSTTVTPIQAVVSVNAVNDEPTFTTLTTALTTGNEDSQINITMDNITAQSNAADVDGAVVSYVVKAVSSGILLIGTSSGTATAWALSTNDTIDATHFAYWTPAVDANGSLNAFTVVAKDNVGLESATAIQAQINVNNVNDLPAGTFSITGIATQGQQLMVSNNLLDADGMGTVTYTWYASGSVTPIGTGSTYTLTQAEVGKTITAVASYTDLLGTSETVTSLATVSIANINDSTTGTVSISGNLIQGQQLTASNNLVDADGVGTVTYTWYASGSVTPIGTGSTYTLSQSEVGKTITAVASYIDLLGTAESVTSSVTTAVANLNDLPTGSVSISGTATQGQQLTASNNLVDADGMGTVSYTWYASGSATPIGTGSIYTLTQAEVGKTITAVASYTDLLGTPETVTSLATVSIANLNDLPTGSVSISGTIAQGWQLTASNTIDDADGLGDITYNWYASGSEAVIGTGKTYILKKADAGKTVTARASYLDGQGTSESVTSSPTSQVLTSIIVGKLGNDSLLGTLGDDQISGLKGNDILDGGLGIDTLIGGLGNDIYIIDSTTDTITELVNQGTDIVKSSVSFSLENIFNLENLTLTGNSSINGTGNSLKNVITGNSNSNQLDGGLGNDTLVGGFGDDTYVVDSLSDVVTEKALQGNDTIVTSNLKTYSLSKLGNVENLIYTGSESAKLTGNGLDNSLMGSILNDTLIGGLGNDTLTGGSGADHFVFNTKLNGLTNVDTIAAFEVGADKIDLSKAIFKTVGAKGVLSADAFNSGEFIGGQNPTDRIIYNTTTGALYYDVDGSGTKSSVQIAVIGIDSHANLTNTDFLIIA